MPKKEPHSNGAAVAEPSETILALKNASEEETAVTVGISPEMFEEDAGGHTFERDDLAIPFIRVLQNLSPQVNKRDPQYIEGAEVGNFINTVSNRLYSGEKGIVVIPVAYTPSYTEWKPNRGGFVKDHGADASIMRQTVKGGKDNKEDVLPNGNIINRAGLYYVFVFDEDVHTVEQAVQALSSTALKVSRKWNTAIQTLTVAGKNNRRFNPAMFYMSYRIRSLYTENDQGNWFTLDVQPFKPTVELGPEGANVYLAARKFKEMVSAGAVQVKHEQQEEAASDPNVPF